MNKILKELKAIKIRRTKEPYRPVCKLEHLEKILVVNDQLKTNKESKALNRAILSFAFYTGVRISELVNLELEHLYLSENKVFIKHGKGGKNRWIGINKDLKPEIDDYINHHRPTTALQEVFVLPNGRKLTRDRLEKRIKLLANKAGLPGGLHMWRRACLTHYASKGAPISYLQAIAGHSSVLTTQNYIKPDIEDIIKDQVNW
jgi:integrase/recombinase XerD